MQICVVRDGAHGTLESGISGEREGIVHSVIVSNANFLQAAIAGLRTALMSNATPATVLATPKSSVIGKTTSLMLEYRPLLMVSWVF